LDLKHLNPTERFFLDAKIFDAFFKRQSEPSLQSTEDTLESEIKKRWQKIGVYKTA